MSLFALLGPSYTLLDLSLFDFRSFDLNLLCLIWDSDIFLGHLGKSAVCFALFFGALCTVLLNGANFGLPTTISMDPETTKNKQWHF